MKYHEILGFSGITQQNRSTNKIALLCFLIYRKLKYKQVFFGKQYLAKLNMKILIIFNSDF